MLCWGGSVCSSHSPLVSRPLAGFFQGKNVLSHPGLATRSGEALLLQEGSCSFSAWIIIR